MFGECMKKIFFVFVGIILFTGCSSKNVMKCSYKSKESDRTIDLSYKVKHKGSKVLSVKSVEKVTSSDSDIISSYKADVEGFYEPFKYIDNYSYKIKLNDKHITVTTFIDYSKIDLNEMIMIDPDIEQLMNDGYIDLDQMKISYENLGLECKK